MLWPSGHAVWTVVFPPECISHCSVAFYLKIRMGTGAELNAAVPAIASRSPLADLSQKRPLFRLRFRRTRVHERRAGEGPLEEGCQPEEGRAQGPESRQGQSQGLAEEAST